MAASELSTPVPCHYCGVVGDGRPRTYQKIVMRQGKPVMTTATTVDPPPEWGRRANRRDGSTHDICSDCAAKLQDGSMRAEG